MAIISFLLLITANNNFILVIGYFSIWISFISIAPIIDGFILNQVQEKNYYKIRMMGSFGAAIGYFVNSYVMGSFQLRTVFSLNIALLIIMYFIIISIEEKKESEPKFKNKMNYKEGMKHIIQKPELLIIFGLTLLAYGTLGGDDAYTYLYETTEVGISPMIVGIVGFFSIFIETLIIFLFPKIKLYVNKLLLISVSMLVIVFFIKFTGYQHSNLIIISDLLIGVFTGIFIPLSIILLNQNSEKLVKNTVLSIYQMTIKIGASVVGLMTAITFGNTKIYHQIYLLHLIIILFAVFVCIIFWKKFNYKLEHEN